ncbi:hypothetical protein ACSBR2_036213 [Camellia fascicularis]
MGGNIEFEVVGLLRVMSDHSPLLLMEDERDWGPRPFRFVNAWMLHSKFLPFVEKWWREHQVEGWAGFRLFQKLKELKLALKQWNRKVFDNVNTKLKKAEDELRMIDLLAEERELEEAEKIRSRGARVEAGHLTRMVEWLWFQKSRLNWNFNGDKNTKYFHVLVKYRQGRNEINTLTVGDVVVDDLCRVKLEVLAYFRKQYSKDWQHRPVLEGPFKSMRDSPCFDMLEVEVVVDKRVSLSAMMVRKEEASEWVFQFRRALFDWERVELIRLVSQIEAGPVIRCYSEDALVWKASESV